MKSPTPSPGVESNQNVYNHSSVNNVDKPKEKSTGGVHRGVQNGEQNGNLHKGTDGCDTVGSQEPDPVNIFSQGETTGTVDISANKVKVQIHNVHTEALVDTGAQRTCISAAMFKRIRSAEELSLEKPDIPSVRGVGGDIIRVCGKIVLSVAIAGLLLYQEFLVLERMHQSVILGTDFLAQQKATICFESNTLSLQGGMSEAQLGAPAKGRSAAVYTARNVEIPPHCEVSIPCTVKGKLHSNGLIEPIKNLPLKYFVAGATCLVCPLEGKTSYRVVNPTAKYVTLPSRTLVGLYRPLPPSADITPLPPSDPLAQSGSDVNTVTGKNPKLSESDREHHIAVAKDLGINLENSSLTEDQKKELLCFLGQNRSIFAKDLYELESTNLYSHTIETGDAPPIRSRHYRYPPEKRDEIERQVKKMLEAGIVEPAFSEWVSPVVLVRKKNGEMRFAVDYREVNRCTKVVQFPLPRFEDVLDCIGQSKATVYSTLDCASGFWQIKMSEESKHKTAFITQSGTYQFRKMPFGLVNAPMSFQMVMSEALRGLNWKFCICYVDDVLIHSRDFEQHMTHLAQVFARLKDANLKLQPAKCKFAVPEVYYLGHVLKRGGVAVDTAKTEAVRDFPTPKRQKDVRAFLGLAGYYRRFVKGFAKIATPLNRLLQQDTKFEWTPECEAAFNSLKQHLANPPILAFPDFSKDFILCTDSSDFAIGYVLEQLDGDGRERVIAYAGRALSKAEQKWGAADRECLALVAAVKAFHVYLANSYFKVYTDNAALQYIRNTKQPCSRRMRWATKLMGYNFDIKHRPGKENSNADGLSRREYAPIPEEEDGRQEMSISTVQEPTHDLESSGEVIEYRLTFPSSPGPVKPQNPLTSTLINLIEAEATYEAMEPIQALQECSDMSPIDIQKLQEEDPECSAVIRYLLHKEFPEKGKSDFYVKDSANCFMENGILYRSHYPRGKGTKVDRHVKLLYLPQSLRHDVITAYHDAIGHLGVHRTFSHIQLKYYWHNMAKEIEDYIRSCVTCQQVKNPTHARRAPLQPLPVGGPFSRIHMDFLGPLPKTPQGERHILLLVDAYSKWPEAFVTCTQEASEVARILYDQFICRYGAMDSILTDRGQCFMSNVVKELCRLLKIDKISTSAYHPQTNAHVERMNGVVTQILRCYTKEDQSDWADHLQTAMLALRASPCTESTTFTPYQLLFGRECRLPIDTMLTPPAAIAKDQQQQVNKIHRSLQITQKIVAENRQKSQQKYKAQHDKKAKKPAYRLGQKVWLYCTVTQTGLSKKLRKKWTGPYYITLDKGNYTYRLRNCANNRELKSPVHADRLKPYFEQQDRPTVTPTVRDDLVLDPEDMTDDNVRDSQPPTSESGDDQENRPDNMPPTPTDTQTQPERQAQPTQGTDPTEQLPMPLTPPNDGRAYPIEKLMQAKYFGKTKYYKVKWVGFKHSTWEPENALPQELVHEFFINKTMTGKAKKGKQGKTAYRPNPCCTHRSIRPSYPQPNTHLSAVCTG